MAISALIAVDRAYITPGQPVHVLLTISNSGASDVTVSDVCSVVDKSYSGSTGKPSMGPGTNLTVPAGGSLKMTWSQTFFAGVQAIQPEFFYNIGATVYTSDGSVTAASPQCTVNVVPQQTPSTVPSPGVLPSPPVAGQVRFDTNISSGLPATLF